MKLCCYCLTPILPEHESYMADCGDMMHGACFYITHDMDLQVYLENRINDCALGHGCLPHE